ncbi:MAG: type IV toxin-antitoxin system AbiEi family antitoxin [Actinomycetota bacterium]|nr:type IV toxin-antitoxin system AbiEi family antitoxin [Actinomycetota bacterium]
MRQPKIVTRELLAEMVEERGVPLAIKDISERLQRHGWLLSLKTQGAWEFAPAARAGPIGSGDPFIELRATLLRRPGLSATVAYDSAAWIHGLAGRAPEKHVLAIPAQTVAPPALRDFRFTRQTSRLGPVEMDGLPTWRIETLLVLMGAHPTSYRAWPTVGEWLAEASEKVDQKLILEELKQRPRSAWARTGYLLETGGRVDVAEAIERLAPEGKGPFYLGSRKSGGRHDRRWDVRDSVLRFRDIQATDSGTATDSARVSRR